MGATTVWMMQRYRRRTIRLQGYDYSQPGMYFVTICVQRWACLFGEVVDGTMCLNDAGRMIKTTCGRPAPCGLSLPDVVQRFKTLTTKRYIDGVNQSGWPPFAGRLWQRNYYEHIIRNPEALDRIRQYICDNPSRWAIDRENPAMARSEIR